MDADLLHALCALAALCLPLGVAWLVVRLHTSRRLARARARRQARGAPTAPSDALP